MATVTGFNPAAAGFRVSEGPIRRKARTPSTKPQPKPRYADAVWYSFDQDHPLEAVVPTRSVEDTVRALKRAARYLERTNGVEVRVQIGVEPVLDAETGEPAKPAKSTVKFLGHKPWLLGRRISKTVAEAREAGAQAAEDIIAARAPGAHRRRTTASTRGQHARASLPQPVVRAVITRPRPPYPPARGGAGVVVFHGVFPSYTFDQRHEFPLLAMRVTGL